MSVKKITIGVISFLMLVTLLQGCNTMRGAGQDIEEAGEAIEDAAD